MTDAKLVEAAMRYTGGQATDWDLRLLAREVAVRGEGREEDVALSVLHREVLHLREQLRWIPVTERLPEEGAE